MSKRTAYETYRFKIVDPNPGKVSILRQMASDSCCQRVNFSLEMTKEYRPVNPFELHRWVYCPLRRMGLTPQLPLA